MSNHSNFSYLLQGYIAGTLSEQEKKQLLQTLNDPENVNRLSAIIAGVCKQTQPESFAYDKEKVEKMIRGIVARARAEQTTETTVNKSSHYPVSKTNKIRSSGALSWIRYVAAALFLGALFYYNHTKKVTNNPVARVSTDSKSENDVLPGKNKAVLTLSNGKTVELDETDKQVITDGEIAIQNNNGSLSYGRSDVIAYNTMTTPRGGQYKLKLPDGTWVWLNASSSITYPTAFPGKTRVVNISGEAYFEVAKNPEKPFTVQTYKDEITVKGTSFNVNCYADEPGIKTSLLEGLVEINHTLLKPGYAYTGGKVTPADLDKELAWKNGVFNFHHAKLEDAMRQIARWYDVEVRYEGNVKEIELGGEIGRNLTLKQLLNGLQDKDTHFRLEGKMLTVY